MLENKLHLREQMHILRKLWHVFWGTIILCILHFELLRQKDLRWILLLIACLGFGVDFIRLNKNTFNKFFVKTFAPFLRHSERSSFSGFPFYAFGVSLCLFFYEGQVAIVSIFILVFGDPLAACIGVLFGKRKFLPHKSIAGSTALFLFSLLTLFYICEYNSFYSVQTFALCVAGSLMMCFSELLSAFNIDDNLTIPIVGGGLLSALNYYFTFI